MADLPKIDVVVDSLLGPDEWRIEQRNMSFGRPMLPALLAMYSFPWRVVAERERGPLGVPQLAWVIVDANGERVAQCPGPEVAVGIVEVMNAKGGANV